MRPKLTDLDVLRAMERVEAGTLATDGYPSAATREVARVIVDLARDAEHLEAAAEHLVNTCRWRPVASEWREALEATALVAECADHLSSSYGCAACDWTGYRCEVKGLFTGATACSCIRDGKASARPDEPVSDAVLRQNLRVKTRLERALAGKVAG